MPLEFNYVVLVVIVCAIITFLTRFFPFLLFQNGKMPKFLQKLSNELPLAIVSILIVYSIKYLPTITVEHGLYLGISITLVVISYLWKKNILISIALGVVTYMVLINIL